MEKLTGNFPCLLDYYQNRLKIFRPIFAIDGKLVSIYPTMLDKAG
jgi:hypothetical protein